MWWPALQVPGYWFIFPVESVIGLSENETYFDDRFPAYAAAGTFRGNSAHSCVSGIDMKDGISAVDDETIQPNWIWRHNWPDVAAPVDALFEKFTAYGCYKGIYTGGGTESQPIPFKHSVLTDNVESLRLGKGTTVEASLLHSFTGNVNIGTQGKFSGLAIYDGPAHLENCLFVEFQTYNACLRTAAVAAVGGQTVRASNSIIGATYVDGYGSLVQSQPIIKFPDDSAGIWASSFDHGEWDNNSHIGNPSIWAQSIRNTDSSVWLTSMGYGQGATTITSKNPLVVAVGGELNPVVPMTGLAQGARLSTVRFGLLRIQKVDALDPLPEVSFRRQPNPIRNDLGTVSFDNKYTNVPHRQILAIVQDNFVYTVKMLNNVAIPMEGFQTRLDDVDNQASDSVLLRFLNSGPGQLTNIAPWGGPNGIENSSNTTYAVIGNDLWVKLVPAVGENYVLVTVTR